MGSGLFFPICAFFVNILVLFMFFFKKHLNTTETKLYSYLIISNLFGIILEIFCTFASIIHEEYLFFSNLILKSYLVYLIVWATIFMIYILIISNNKDKILNNKSKYLKITYISLFVSILLVYILPIELVIKDNFAVRYTTGFSVKFTYLVSSVIVTIMLISMLKNIKNLKNKKYLPLFAFLIIGAGSMYIQMVKPSLLLMTSVETYIILFMYFTIENPDLKMIDEIVKAKEIASISNENKSKFIRNIVYGIKKPLENINEICDDALNTRTLKEMRENIKLINEESNKINFIINDTLDISNISNNKIKVYNTKYNIHNLIKEIELKNKDNISDELKFLVNVDSDIPSYLYGDNLKIKQVILSLLNKSFIFNKGYLNLDVSSIIKGDICRLIITIEDSNTSISLDEIDDILNNTKEEELTLDLDQRNFNLDLKEIKKVIDYLGGTFLIQSNSEITKYIITLDQKISDSESLSEYDKVVLDRKKIIIVDNNYLELRKKFKEEYYLNNIDAEFVMYPLGVIKNIRNNKKYDFVIINDESISYEQYQNIKEIIDKISNEDDNIKFIILSNKNNEILNNNDKIKILSSLGLKKDFIQIVKYVKNN